MSRQTNKNGRRFALFGLFLTALAIAGCSDMPTDFPSAHAEDTDQATASVITQPAFPDNEPAGMTELRFVDGSTKDFPGFNIQAQGWDDVTFVVADTASKYGNVVEKRWAVGTGSGWNGVTSTNFGDRKEIYVRIVFKLSNNWQWHSGGGKWFYYRPAQQLSGQTPWAWVLMWQPNGQMSWLAETQGIGRYVAEGVPPISRGVYHTVEIHHGASTSGANGFFRMWQNGTKVQSYRSLSTGQTGIPASSLENIEWNYTKTLSNKKLRGLQAFLFWGGQGDTKTVNDHVRLSELYISGKN